MADCDASHGCKISCTDGCYAVYNHNTGQCSKGCSDIYTDEVNDTDRYSIEVNGVHAGEIFRVFGGNAASLADDDRQRTISFKLDDVRAADIMKRVQEMMG
jgi:hypothetical protein